MSALQEVTFRVDYTVPSINREFGSVFLGDKNVALLVVAGGWAKVFYCYLDPLSVLLFALVYSLSHMIYSDIQVREQGQQKGESSPYLTDLLRLEEQAKQQGVGRWNRVCIIFVF